METTDYVYLVHENRAVATKKYFVKPGGGPREQCTRIDGQDLSVYRKGNEELVAVYHVQVHDGFGSLVYPFAFGGPENAPSTIGEMNVFAKSFKRRTA